MVLFKLSEVNDAAVEKKIYIPLWSYSNKTENEITSGL